MSCRGTLTNWNLDTAQDENEAIDQSNIISSRTRGATKPAGTYQEPGDEEVGLPSPVPSYISFTMAVADHVNAEHA